MMKTIIFSFVFVVRIGVKGAVVPVDFANEAHIAHVDQTSTFILATIKDDSTYCTYMSNFDVRNEMRFNRFENSKTNQTT